VNEHNAADGHTPLDRRSFSRHPAHVPLRVGRADAGEIDRIDEVGYGGLSFLSPCGHETGTALRLRIDAFQPAFEAIARVAWCREAADGYHVGVTFDDPEVAFRSRLVEQICAIERYRVELGDCKSIRAPTAEVPRRSLPPLVLVT
jgi:hypothetical protein